MTLAVPFALARGALSARRSLPRGSFIALYDAVQHIGILNADVVFFAIRELGPRMAAKVRRIDDSALQEMVSLARSRVPVDTGRLLNGITGETEDEYHVFRASAVRTRASGKQGADYARFVEFGTKPGRRGGKVSYMSLDGFYNGPVTGFEAGPGRGRPRTRRQYRGHPGTPAQPFFYNSAREVMQERFATFETLPVQTGRELGLPAA